MQGKRHDLANDEYALAQGEYGKDVYGEWFVCPPAPGFGTGSIRQHDVTEHEDGTITVSPSIPVYGHFDKQWHGYLERGIWREV